MAKLDRLGWTAGTAVSCFGVQVGFRANDAAGLAALAERFPPYWKASRAVQVDRLYSIVFGRRSKGSNGRRWHLLYEDIVRVARTASIEHVHARIENGLQLWVASFARRHIFLHAGVVGWQGGALVMPGRSFSGKTTLVSALLKAGATYYSDEYAVLDERGRVHPFPRALSIRGRTRSAARSCPPEAFGSIAGTKPLPVRWVAAFRYHEGARFRPRRLSPGRATLALLANTVPAREAPERALRTLRRVVDQSPVFEGRRGEAEDTAFRLLELME